MKKSMLQYAHMAGIALIAVMAGTMISCGSDSESDSGIKRNGVVFYSASSPGPWIDQAADHDPELTITRVDDRKTLNVNVPFTQQKEKNHFIEAIVILDSKGHELKKVVFAKGRSHKGAQFEFPENFNTPVYVVIKCNKHDMWEKLVDWSE